MGSDLIVTDFFGETGFCLKLHDAQDRVLELNAAAAKLARQAADSHTKSTRKKVVVAGSIGLAGTHFY